MSRLIDADALKYEPLPKGEITYHPYTLDDAYEDGYDDAFENVRNAPTVDAIPISFIRSEIERMKEGNNRYYSECEAYAEDLDILLMEWEKRKNETN